jgi:hypothetical protein
MKGRGSCVLFSCGCRMLGDSMAKMKSGVGNPINLRLPGLRLLGPCGILVAALGAGCARSDKHKPEEPPARITGIPAPATPVFLNGAMALLFTNTGGFRAHVVLERPAMPGGSGTLSGELMGRGSDLLFTPQPGAAHDKYSRVEDFSYLWNVEGSRGFLMSGPLQGYAPISSAARFARVEFGSAVGGQERVSGYACQKSEAKVVAEDGAETVFQVWRAAELKGMPVRIARTVQGAPLTVTLSRVRLEAPPGDLFAPPADFTRYNSAELMMNELVSRQQNLKRKRGWEPPPSEEVGAPNLNAPTPGQPK